MNRPNTGTLPSVEELMEQYAALVWKTAASYLENPEDIKECVNDTFLEFCLHSDRYDPGKGSYAAFLCTIARRKAISMYRKNRKASGFSVVPGKIPDRTDGQTPENRTRSGLADSADMTNMTDPADIADPFDIEETVAGRLDLEAALQSLKPEEFDIIRMKYYDGMTIKEIADSLNLSYETVKKRHQRSLTKLQKALTIGLILAVIAALAACAYVVLRYFGIVPGYGVNTNPEIPFYQSGTVSPDTAADGGMELEFISARYINDRLYIDVRTSSENGNSLSGQQRLQPSVRCGEAVCGYRYGTSDYTTTNTTDEEGRQIYRCEFYLPELSELLASGKAPEVEAYFSVPDYDSVDYSDEASWYTLPPDEYTFSFSFTLEPLRENALEHYSYGLTEEGGLLLIPSITGGELTVDIYPLNPEEGEILPSLIYSVFPDSGETGAVTASAEDGTVLAGTCVQYTPFSQNTYFTWNFGPAKPGSYTLNVPYLLKRYPVQEALQLPVRLEEGYISESSLTLPAGGLSVGPVEVCSSLPEEGYAGSGQPLSEFPEDASYWWMPVHLEPSHPDESLLFITPHLAYDEEKTGPAHVLPPLHMTYLEPARDNTLSFLIQTEKAGSTGGASELDCLLLKMGAETSMTSYASASQDAVYTRWNHSFSIPFTVEESAESLPAAGQE